MSEKRTIPASELIINEDGTIFHLHLLPEQIADIILLVGDPGRVEMIASFFDSRECEVSNREFKTVTGSYKGKRMTVLSTGIGIGNIDICVTELDALANIDFATRQVKDEFKQLTMLRLGTSGALQEDIKVGEYIFTYKVGRDHVPVVQLGKVGSVYADEDAISFENGETYSVEFIAGRPVSQHEKIGGILSVIESKWGFLFIVLVPVFLIFIYEIYSLIIEIKYGAEED